MIAPALHEVAATVFMTDSKLTGEPKWWPRDPYGHVFLARAVERIGAARHSDWTGTETSIEDIELLPTSLADANLTDKWHADILLGRHRADLGRPNTPIGAGVPQFTEEHWRVAHELAQRLYLEAAPALKRLRAIQTEIMNGCEAGELVLRTRPVAGGSWQDFKPEWWNWERWRLRFDRCKIDPEYPFGVRPSWREEGDHWIFVTQASLNPFLIKISHVDQRRRGGRKPEFDWEVILSQAERLMGHHGEFDASDPEWNAKARLEEALKSFSQEKWGREPSTAVLRERLARWLPGYRRRKR
jgi:hypothetical protein